MPEGFVIFPEPRPDICTGEFRPVCALVIKDSGEKSWQNLPNVCVACSNDETIDYLEGLCA